VSAWTVVTVWPGVAAGVVTESVGAQCWGCGHRLRRKGTDPQRWHEVLCDRPGCSVEAILGRPA
jgi:hypothetical protein